MAEIGDRVGAILKYKDENELNFIRLLGYGVYEGKFRTPAYPLFKDIFPYFNELHDDEQILIKQSYEYAKFSHRIKLDGGDVVWSQECIWGPEARIKRSLLGKRVLRVRILRYEDTGGFREFFYVN